MGRQTLGLVVLLVGGMSYGGAPAALSPRVPLESVFEIPRSDEEDVLYFRNRDVLRGQVLNDEITLATQYGILSLPLRTCAGISFEGERTNTEEVAFVNFNRITGVIGEHVLRFRISPSGAEIPVRKEKVRFVVLGKRPQELDFLKDRAEPDLFLMANGDVLTGETLERKISIRTDYGQVPLSFAEMQDIQLRGQENITALITKRNGDTLHGTLETEALSLRLALGVDLPAVYRNKFAKILVGQAETQAPAQFARPLPAGLEEPEGSAPAAPAAPGDRTTTLYLGNQVTLKLVLIPAGKFLMGSPSEEPGRHDDEGTLREVTITRPFYMGVHEVTQAQYAAIMGSNPATFKAANKPVETVSWGEAVEFCLRLSRRVGKKVSLPTEAQWEYACRAGSRTRFCSGSDEKQLAAYARFGQGSDAGTAAVGTRKPNVWGLYDMHGNITEWCFDWYNESPESGPAVDPVGPKAGQLHVVRGGCWGNGPEDCRSAARKGFLPDSRTGYRGFRVVVDSN